MNQLTDDSSLIYTLLQQHSILVQSIKFFLPDLTLIKCMSIFMGMWKWQTEIDQSPGTPSELVALSKISFLPSWKSAQLLHSWLVQFAPEIFLSYNISKPLIEKHQ